MSQKISFFFQPFNFENNGHAVEKSIDGMKKKYLKGIASGTQIDGHGERITENCIKSFHNQAESGDLLLYADKHGVSYTEDIGILEKSAILPNYDWDVEFRLYDESDGVGQNTLETVDKLWRQCNGLPPYRNKKQKGFSIEGIIPDNGIIKMDGDGRRVVNDVILDGCVIVPRPAYLTSIAHSLYKALGEKAPWQLEKSYGNYLRKSIDKESREQSYYKNVYVLNDTLTSQIEMIMTDDLIEDKKSLLESLFDEYKSIMLESIMNNAEAFEIIEPYEDSFTETRNVYQRQPDKKTVLKGLLSNLDLIQSKIENYN